MTQSAEIDAVVEAAREVAENARLGQRWNYDPIECAALYAVQDAFERFAGAIEAPERTGS